MTAKFINMGRVSSIARKEFKHILRDPFTLAMALGLPMILVTFFGFVIDLNYRNVQIMYADRDQSRASREFIETFSSSGYFKIAPLPPGSSLAGPLDSGRASGALAIERDFGKKIASGEKSKVQILLDGSDNSKAGVVLGYLSGILQAAAKKLSPAGYEQPVDVKTRFLFNPELSSRWFVVPGLAVIIIGLLSVLLTALTVAREWENGSMELLLSTPVRPLEIVFGKITPYVLLGLGGTVFVYAVARLVFDIPFLGSPLVYAAACTIFVVTALAQGLLISVVTRQQQIAMQISMVSGLLPSLLLSGFIFPIESMPVFFRYFTAILPQRWFMVISRGVFLKGSGFGDLIVPFGALIILGSILIILAVKKFKSDLEP